MRIAFLVNDIAGEVPQYATTLLAIEALRRGHEVHYLTIDDFTYRADDQLEIRARSAPKKSYRSGEKFLSDLQGPSARVERLLVTDCDVVMLRNDPALDRIERPWAQSIGIVFGRDAARRGVIVLNDPAGLAKALNKLYFHQFPEEVRPKTVVSRDRDVIISFVQELQGPVILKPLQGSGGQSVFLVHQDEDANLNQMFEAVSRDGYVIAQEYIPAAARGDIRFFLMNGRPLTCRGKYAAFRRVHAEGDLRSNIHAGGHSEKAQVDETALRIAALVGPRLVQDGMFLVGLDIAGDKLLEINVFSPGGLLSASETQEVNFTQEVVEAIERKVECARTYPGAFDNQRLAVL